MSAPDRPGETGPEAPSPLAGPADEAGSARFIAAERARRLAKLDGLRARGIDPYPVTFARDRTLGEVRSDAGVLAPDAVTGTTVRVAGRVMGLRDHGGLVFLDLHDRTGELQALASATDFDAAAFADVQDLDLGDWIGVEGEVVASHTGELSVRATRVVLLSKSLRALPARLTDVDTRLRERYLDLIVNADTRRTFEIRSTALATVRRVLVERGFVEVETPVLDLSAGGAAARPFVTHHNALDLDMYLRIALELPLKRLVVGGMERVFEIGRVFRNEGLDTRHNPEFSLLEAYQALGDYRDMMDLVEMIVSEACRAAIGTTVIQIEGRDVDLAPPWRRITMAGLIEERTGEKMHPSMPLGQARAICDRLHIPWETTWGAGRLMSEVYDETGEGTLVEPTFVYDYPREVSPLARTHRDDPTMTERFEAVVAGRELANAYSELNDPVDQRGRFEAEAAAKAAGDDEAQDVDEDYIRALEYGLPPTGGLGIGLDRMVMLIAGAAAIRDVILFPTMRPVDGTGHRLAAAAATSAAIPTAASLGPPPTEPAAPPVANGAAPEGAAPPNAAAPAASAGPSSALAAPARRGWTRSAGRPPTILPHETVVKVLAWLTALGAVLWLLPFVPGLHARFGVLHHEIFNRPDRIGGHVVSVVAGLALLFLAPQLAHHKHRAWQGALVVFVLGAVTHVLKGPHPLLVLYALAMIVALVWFRGAFLARADPGSLLSVVRFLVGYVFAVLVFGVGSLLIEQGHVTSSLDVAGVLETVFGGLVGLSGPYTFTGRFFSTFYPDALLALGIAGVATVIVLAVRAVAQRSGPTAEDRERARRIVRAHGSDTLDYFALRSDKSYFFGSDGESLVAYSYVSGYALVAGDPIVGDGPGHAPATARVVEEFLTYCRERAWHVAFLAVREDDLAIYRSFGFHGIYLGDEAIIRCDTFSLAGSAMKPVRSAVTRVGKTHTFSLLREVDAPPALRDELNAIRDRWRGKAPERGFTMELGKGVEGQQPDFLLAVAYDAAQKPVGFLRLVPCYGTDPGYSLDLMQRDPDCANGVTEYLIANAALALGQRGFRRLSMNFAAWGRLFDPEAHLSIPERLLRRLAMALGPFFQIKSLRDFNEKFAPEWLPRSIVIEEPAAMAKVGVLYASVEGFLVVPVVGKYLVPAVRADGHRAA